MSVPLILCALYRSTTQLYKSTLELDLYLCVDHIRYYDAQLSCTSMSAARYGIFTLPMSLCTTGRHDSVTVADIKTSETIRITFRRKSPEIIEPYVRLEFQEKPYGLFARSALFLLMSSFQLGIPRNVLKIILELSRSGRNAACWKYGLTNKRKR